jgi:hypothetical protein
LLQIQTAQTESPGTFRVDGNDNQPAALDRSSPSANATSFASGVLAVHISLVGLGLPDYAFSGKKVMPHCVAPNPGCA